MPLPTSRIVPRAREWPREKKRPQQVITIIVVDTIIVIVIIIISTIVIANIAAARLKGPLSSLPVLSSHGLPDSG